MATFATTLDSYRPIRDREEYDVETSDPCQCCPGRLIKVAERYRAKLFCENDSTKCGLFSVCASTCPEEE